MPRPITDIDDPRLVKALAHPIRVRILGILEDRSPYELLDGVVVAKVGEGPEHGNLVEWFSYLFIRNTDRATARVRRCRSRCRSGCWNSRALMSPSANRDTAAVMRQIRRSG